MNRKKLLKAALEAILAASDTAWWLKGPATFIAQLSGRLDGLPEEQQAALAGASHEDLHEALIQIQLTAEHSAYTAAGVDRIESGLEQLVRYLRERRIDVEQHRGGAYTDAHIQRLIKRLAGQIVTIDGERHSLLSIFIATANDLAAGCSLAYFGVLLQDYLGLENEAGWAGLRDALGFETSEIFGQFIKLGLWTTVPDTDPKDESYRLSELGQRFAQVIELEEA